MKFTQKDIIENEYYDNVYEFIYQLSKDNVDSVRNCAKTLLVKYYGEEEDELKSPNKIFEQYEYVNIVRKVEYAEHCRKDILEKAPEEIDSLDELDLVFEPDAIHNYLYFLWNYNCINPQESAKVMFRLFVYSIEDWDYNLIEELSKLSNESLYKKYFIPNH